jgi:hypothetical protein
MSDRAIPIFYEDDRGGVKEFGPHELLVACIADTCGQDWWAIRARFEPIPKKGDANLLKACRDDVPDMPDSLIFALFDADKLHRRLFESSRPSVEELLAELRCRCPDDRLHMFLLRSTSVFGGSRSSPARRSRSASTQPKAKARPRAVEPLLSSTGP